MTRETSLLRDLANAIEAVETLKKYDYPVQSSVDFRVQWAVGASCSGYEEMRKAISIIAAAHYGEFRQRVIQEAEMDVARLRGELVKLGKSESKSS